MSTAQKVWVIDPVSTRAKPCAAKKSVDSNPSAMQSDSAHAEQSPPDLAARSNDGLNGKRNYVLFSVLSYALGPFAILATEQGRRSKFWVSAAVGSGVASALFVFRWHALLARSDEVNLDILPILLVACLAIIAGFAAWSHAILLIGRHRRSIQAKLPQWMRRPWVVGSFGLLVPGFGLFIAGHSRRAVCALWTACILILSIIVLSNGALLWNWYHEHGVGAVSGHAVEFTFMAFCAAGLLGCAGWIVQALDGARLSGRCSARPGQSRSDRLAVVLLLMVAAFFVMFESEYVAVTLDRFAASERREEFQVIPLYMILAAIHLDPSRPEYVLHAIELYDEMGRHGNAETMRGTLHDRLMPCVGFMQQYGPFEPHSSPSLRQENTQASNGILEKSSPLLRSPAAGEISQYMSVF